MQTITTNSTRVPAVAMKPIPPRAIAAGALLLIQEASSPNIPNVSKKAMKALKHINKMASDAVQLYAFFVKMPVLQNKAMANTGTERK